MSEHTTRRNEKGMFYPKRQPKKEYEVTVSRTVVSRDMGGHVEYQSSWLKDMWQRKVKTIVVVLDHRHLEDVSNTENQLHSFLSCKVVTFTDSTEGLGLKRIFQRKYMPRRVIVLMNKADLWMDEEAYELWEKGFIVRHSIFDAFRQTLYEFQEANIPVRCDACAASIGWNVDDAIFKGLMDLLTDSLICLCMLA